LAHQINSVIKLYGAVRVITYVYLSHLLICVSFRALIMDDRTAECSIRWYLCVCLWSLLYFQPFIATLTHSPQSRTRPLHL